jgi:hypothetical protein
MSEKSPILSREDLLSNSLIPPEDSYSFLAYLYQQGGADKIGAEFSCHNFLSALFDPVAESVVMDFAKQPDSVDEKTKKVGAYFVTFVQSYSSGGQWEYPLYLLLHQLGYADTEINKSMQIRTFNEKSKAHLNDAALKLNMAVPFPDVTPEDSGSLLS